MLLFSINNICKVTMFKVQSKGRYLLLKKSFFKDYNKRLVGTTQVSSWASDITNPKIYLSPAPGNTQPMLRREKAVVVTCVHLTTPIYRLCLQNKFIISNINSSTNHSEASCCILHVVISS